MFWCIALLGIVFIYILFILPTKWLKIERIDVPLSMNKKVLQISDIHIEKNRISVTQIKRVIKKEKPDYLFFTGDYCDSPAAEKKLRRFLSSIMECGTPAYGVLGNHDYGDKNDPAKVEKILEEEKIVLLKNKHIELDDFYLIGIDDYHTNHHHEKKAFKGIDRESNKKKIILTHDPTIALDLKSSYDLLLSGHLHGKQINLPFLFKIKNKGKLAKMGIYKGLNGDENGWFYISKGIGQTRVNIRFMVRSEITILEL